MDANFEKRLSKIKLSSKMAEVFKWQERITKIPFITFPSHWEVKIIPPIGGVIIRFLVRRPYTKGEVSVYLDFDAMLSINTNPYWEVYPYNGDVGRCGVKNIEKLLKMIEVGLNELGDAE